MGAPPATHGTSDVHPYLEHRGPIPLAHRGGRPTGVEAAAGAAVENSMAAFADAVGLGYRYLETDVHATVDGVLVAFHDTTLDRVTDASGPIAELPWATVSRARIGGREPIPRLDELLVTWPDVRWNLDAKSDRAIAPLARILARPGLLDRVCVGSFADDRVTALRRALGPGLCTAAGPGEVRRLRVASWAGALGRVVPVAADCLQVPVVHQGTTIVDRRMVDHCHGRGVAVHVWTVNDPDEMRRLLDLGVDGIVTDETRALKAVLRGRGQWHGP